MGIFISILLLITGCSTEPNKKSAITLHTELTAKSIEAKKYCLENNLDTTYCVLIDMKIPSGKFRFFVWDFNTDSILDKGLCSHGSCAQITIPENEEEPYFTNQSGSYCSSLGKYKIGKRGYSNYGIHVNYKLHGLEKTNDNAFDRIIVLHSFNNLENNEIHPYKAIESWGCPAVSDNMMTKMDQRLSKTEKSVLMWIYND